MNETMDDRIANIIETTTDVRIVYQINQTLQTDNWVEFFDELCSLDKMMIPLNKNTKLIIQQEVYEVDMMKRLWDHYIKLMGDKDEKPIYDIYYDDFPRFFRPWLWFQHNRNFFKEEEDRETCDKYIDFKGTINKIKHFALLFEDIMEVLSPASEFLSQNQMHILYDQFTSIEPVHTLSPLVTGTYVNILFWFLSNKEKMNHLDHEKLKMFVNSFLQCEANNHGRYIWWVNIGNNPKQCSLLDKDIVHTFYLGPDEKDPDPIIMAYDCIIYHFLQIIMRDLKTIHDFHWSTSKHKVQDIDRRGIEGYPSRNQQGVEVRKWVEVVTMKYTRKGSNAVHRLIWQIGNVYHCSDKGLKNAFTEVRLNEHKVFPLSTRTE